MLRQELSLAVGAPVVVDKNLTAPKGVVNGTVGTITRIVEGDKPEVHIAIPPPTDAAPGSPPQVVVLTMVTDSVNVYGKCCQRVQFPISLAFARTIHKVQGETITSQLVIHASSIKAEGQGYVALSRATDWKNIVIMPAGCKLKSNMFTPHVPPPPPPPIGDLGIPLNAANDDDAAM